MMNLRVTFGLLVLVIFNVGCATAPPEPYEKFAAAGQSYAQGLNDLMLLAQKTAIDKSSAELIDRNSFANRDDANFNSQQINQLERQHDIDQRRIAVLNDIRRHVLVLSKYFTRLNELATTNEAEKTTEAIAATASNLGNLSAKLRDQAAFELDDDQKTKISKITSYIIGSARNQALQRRIKADEVVIQEALNTHEVLLEAIGDDLEHEQSILNERLYQWYIEEPFVAKTPLLNDPDKALNWMDERRRLMNSATALAELKSASRASASLRNALAKLVADDDDFFTQLNQFKAELEAIKDVIEAF